jgi:hypothetical protein
MNGSILTKQTGMKRRRKGDPKRILPKASIEL